ncbi:hypothetical protein [Mycoplasma sp. P36-A1]|uniref:hypothetical protein n=1 Tax=Mycoplasma sp. P36-A1 TaxID=3252900 RepID=UPI003C2B04EB
MAKSRVKSDAEYQKMLGVEEKKAEDKKVTNDASQYFDELRGTKKTNTDNPFDRVISVSELKESIKNNDPKYSVENIKEEIAKNQISNRNSEKEQPIDLDEVIIVDKNQPTNSNKQKGAFSFEANSRKLYENLRENSISVKSVDAKEVNYSDLKEKDDIEIIEPKSISQERDNSSLIVKDEIETIPDTKPTDLKDEFDKVNNNEDIVNYDVVTDFTRENENFLDQIRQGIASREQQAVEKEEVAEIEAEIEEPEVKIPETDTIEEPQNLDDTLMFSKFFTNNQEQDDDITDEIEIQDTQDLFKHLNSQMESLSHEAEYEDTHINDDNDQGHHTNDTQIINTQPQIDTENTIMSNTKRNNERLSDTLSMALGPNDENSMSTKTLDLSDLEKGTKKKKKRSTIDMVINTVLLIMIAVIIYLLFKYTQG